MDFAITRKIEIDAGHRIPSHGSKCRHLHGHRYVIEANCRAASGRLVQTGEQSGMILDFGFLKDEMIRVIDLPCDHGLIVTVDDIELLGMFVPPGADGERWLADIARDVRAHGFAERTKARMEQKIYVIGDPPTAECLARHWFERLGPAVAERSAGNAQLIGVRVWETPNCWADFGVANLVQAPRAASEAERAF
jgi:6-pyruvoyltetrahydropterin/6-carboxytetrahydropterin synthase